MGTELSRGSLLGTQSIPGGQGGILRDAARAAWTALLRLLARDNKNSGCVDARKSRREFGEKYLRGGGKPLMRELGLPSWQLHLYFFRQEHKRGKELQVGLS